MQTRSSFDTTSNNRLRVDHVRNFVNSELRISDEKQYVEARACRDVSA